MKNTLSLHDFVRWYDVLAIELHTHFEVLVNSKESPFGPVKKSEQFDYEGVIVHQLNEEDKFNDIKIIWISLVRTWMG